MIYALLKIKYVSKHNSEPAKLALFPAVSTGIEFDNDGSGDFGTVTWFGIYDNATHNAGNLLYFGKLTASKAIANGDKM
mgnify:CR=1 FL=1